MKKIIKEKKTKKKSEKSKKEGEKKILGTINSKHIFVIEFKNILILLKNKYISIFGILTITSDSKLNLLYAFLKLQIITKILSWKKIIN